jgi:malonyl CoA-acyl carrier protein transacylase
VDSVRAMTGLGATIFVEFGPKDVLSCLIKRIDPTVGTFAAGTPEEIHTALGV